MALSIEEFLKKWEKGWEQILYSDVGKREKMKADLEEMMGPVTKIRELKKVREDFKEKYKGQSFYCYSKPWDDIHYAHVAFEKACTDFGESL